MKKRNVGGMEGGRKGNMEGMTERWEITEIVGGALIVRKVMEE